MQVRMNVYSFSWRQTGPSGTSRTRGSRGGNVFFRRGFVSHSGCHGEPGVFPRVCAVKRGADRMRIG